MFKLNSTFCVLYTTDIEKTHRFYTAIGFEIKELTSDKVVVSFGSCDFHFILNTSEPSKFYQYITKPGMYGQGVIFYIETDSIEEDLKTIDKAGGVIKADVFENHWGYTELLFEDPNGYKIALYQET